MTHRERLIELLVDMKMYRTSNWTPNKEDFCQEDQDAVYIGTGKGASVDFYFRPDGTFHYLDLDQQL